MSGSSKRSHYSDISRRRYENQDDSRNYEGIIQGLEAIHRRRLRFAGRENKEIAEKFLSRLKKCNDSAKISDSEMLAVVQLL